MTPFGGSMPRLTNRSGESSGTSTTSLNRSICSLHPPTSEYVTSGFSSTCIMVTEGSIFGGRGSWIEYFCRSTPTRIPSSISVGDTRSPRLTTAQVQHSNSPREKGLPNFAICLTLMIYLPFSGSSGFCIILVHRATCKGCSSLMRCRSLSKSHKLGGARPMSLSLTPIFSLTRFETSLISSSSFFKSRAYGPWPYVLRS